MSLIEGLLARGDRRMGTLLVNAWKNGCLFDGWTDQFDLSRWIEALTLSKVSVDFFTRRTRRLDEPLPWDHMDSRIDKQFFKDQWESALRSERLEDCRHGQCRGCGVCDFKTLKPHVHTASVNRSPQASEHVPVAQNEQTFSTFVMTYEKLGPARFFGHLELARHFGRAIRRAGIAVQYSAGYHPMPKISFDDPLPLAVESESEIMRIKVASHHRAQELVERINPFLPAGVQLLACKRTHSKKQTRNGIKNGIKIDRYRVALSDRHIDPMRIDEFQDKDRWDYTRIRHNGRMQQFDLKSVVTQLDAIDTNTIEIGIQADTKPAARPADILRSVFRLSEPSIQGARVRKLRDRASY